METLNARNRAPGQPVYQLPLSRVALPPSITQTPRHADLGACKSYGLGAGEILLPSGGAANNRARAKNAGRCLGPLTIPTLPRATSAPALGAAMHGGNSVPLSSTKTPRQQRGVIRRASRVRMDIPLYPQPLQSSSASTLSPSNLSRPSTSPASTEGRPASSSCSPKGLIRSCKRVSFEPLEGSSIDAAKSSGRSDADLRIMAGQRSKRLLGSLYDLRRAGQASQESQESQSMDNQAAPEETLMCATLRALDDTEAALRKTITMLENATLPVGEFGGSRFATAVIAARSLAVVQRKAALLGKLEKRFASFEAANNRTDEILAGVLAGSSAPPPELQGVKVFLTTIVHSAGNPSDADKSDFESFVASFGLPPKHTLAVRLKDMAAEAADWWACTALREAQAGADADAIRRLMALASAINGSSKHDALNQCQDILGDRLAHQVLQFAEQQKARDELAVERSAVPLPDSARTAAAAINKEITEAAAMGAPAKHPALTQAKAIATHFQAEEKNRHALKALQYAQAARQRDDAAAAKCGLDDVPDVGPASDAADAIEREVKNAVSAGAPESHANLKDALNIAKELRDQDGVRKRMAARSKRLAAE